MKCFPLDFAFIIKSIFTMKLWNEIIDSSANTSEQKERKFYGEMLFMVIRRGGISVWNVKWHHFSGKWSLMILLLAENTVKGEIRRPFHTIGSKVKMCVTGKIWNGISEKSNQRRRFLYSVATFRPSPVSQSTPNKAKRSCVVMRLIW